MQVDKSKIMEIKDEQSFKIYLAAIRNERVAVSYDTETTGLGFADKPFMQTVFASNFGFVIDKRRCHPDIWRDAAKTVLSESKSLLGHNVPFDLLKARTEWGLRFQGKVHDTKITTFLLNENESHALKKQAEKRWPGAADNEKEVKAWLETNNQGKPNYDLIPFEIIAPYAIQDTYLTRLLLDATLPQVEAEFKGLYETECELTKVLVDMQFTGIRMDMPYLQGLVPHYENYLKNTSRLIYNLVGSEFNISSVVELRDVLYRKMGYKATVFTDKGGEPSTDKHALKALNTPLGNLLLEYSAAHTALHTFVIPWLSFCDANGYMHPYVNQLGTRSGRFSSSDPNAQQIPKRSPEAKRLRKAFIYPEGMMGMSVDQRQMEMVGMAHYCQDPTMVKALREGVDLHRAMAAECGIAKSFDECTSDERRVGKGANFATIFGCGVAKLGNFLSEDQYAGRPVSPEEAKEIHTKYHKRFPMVKEFSNRVIRTIRGRPDFSVKNMFGRKCRLSWDKAYVGVNRLVQSWAADQMKSGMVRAWKYAQTTPDLRIYLNVHDDLKMYCDPKNFATHAVEVDRCLSVCPGLSVPIRTELSWSKTNWADEQEISYDDLKAGKF